MNLKEIFYISLVCILLLSYTSSQTLQLKSWNFKLQSDPKLYSTQIPSTLAQDLIKVNLIPTNPYYRDNFLQYYKYQTKNVNYSTTFTAPTSSRGSATSQLIFQGLDTHCDIILNGIKIFSAHNMFRRYVIPITNLTQINTLIVAFYSSALYDIQKQKQFNDQFDFNLPANYSFTRKAAYQYGWDWGPRILTVGIWKQAYIQFSNPVHILSIRPDVSDIWNFELQKYIRFDLSVTLNKLKPKTNYSYSLIIQKQIQTIKIKQSTLFSDKQFFQLNIPNIVLTNGTNILNINNYIWWPWDLGKPNCINITFTITQINDPKNTYTKTVTSGLRMIKVKQEQDSIGKQFTLNVNGIDIFIRGSNYIPPQMSMSNITKQTYLKIKQYALFGKFNMLRIWGGGQFQNQQFYKIMDQAGILIWHDLMFACAMYPVTSIGNQLQNIQKQMEDNLYRIGHHPSIALWNGNNQVWIGWQQWGWKKNLSNSQIIQAQKMYKKIFHQLLPTVIKKITPSTFYWQTSPSSSSNSVKTITSGDIHFWRVWGGGTPIKQYQIFIGRFNSQYGMQSMSDYTTILKYTQAADRIPQSLILRLHQRHPYGDQYLPMYTKQTIGQTKNLKRYAYFTQIMQSYALELAIVSLRGNKPYCMGSIYWQLNDVWPVNSWSTVDYYGMYKAAHYRIRQLHNQLLVHVLHIPATDTTQQIFKAFAVNQYNKIIKLFAVIKIMDFNGTVYKTYQVQKTLAQFQNVVLTRIVSPIEVNKFRSFINVFARDTQGNTYQNNYYYYQPKFRTLIAPNLQLTIIGDNTKLSIKTTNLANYVWIRPVAAIQAQGYNYQKNYFDLKPGEEIIINLPYSVQHVQVTCYQNQKILGLLQEQNGKEQVNQQNDQKIRSEVEIPIEIKDNLKKIKQNYEKRIKYIEEKIKFRGQILTKEE